MSDEAAPDDDYQRRMQHLQARCEALGPTCAAYLAQTAALGQAIEDLALEDEDVVAAVRRLTRHGGPLEAQARAAAATLMGLDLNAADIAMLNCFLAEIEDFFGLLEDPDER